MHYYEVWVRSHRYQNNSALTYSSEELLVPGAIVRVSLQREPVLAIVDKKVSKPRFACKPITEALDVPALPKTSLSLFRWLQAYYPAPLGPLAQLFLPSNIAKNITDVDTSESDISTKIDLNEEQSAAVSQVNSSGTYVLHGRTGSGKTRVYAALAQQQLDAGKSVLVLCPEISLAPQLVEELQALLKREAIVLHSKLTQKQRTEAWQRILNSAQPLLIIGPRSALFAPVKNLGLVVIDEAHEPAYKQEQQPYYYAPRVAAKLTQLHDAVLLMGSATPPVGEYYLATHKRRPIIELSSLATGQQSVTNQTIVDIKDRANFTKKSPHLSDQLIEAIQTSLQNNEQSMLYLNRRGTARLCLCQNCGWQALCPHCDIPMTYHGDSFNLLCHTCGVRQSLLTSCPICNNTEIIFKAAGTKAIADEVTRLFPEARIQRFDTDNLKAERFEQHFEAVKAGEIDILIGTQLLAKGLDLPKLSTLGIVLADSSLAIPDFTAQERTFQLIQQVAGRVGRGHTPTATTVIQTYNPSNKTLQDALSGNWQAFYEREIAERQQFHFPPFYHLLKLVCRRKSSVSAEKASLKFAAVIAETFGNRIEVDGPTPAFHEKSGEYYHWQLVVKAKSRSDLLALIPLLPSSGWAYDIDPINLL